MAVTDDETEDSDSNEVCSISSPKFSKEEVMSAYLKLSECFQKLKIENNDLKC
ncbi:hypothetical protein LINPERPRIM_LOCUS27324, partial [Linum perenne]